jgi:cobalt-zinc-cadmium efflux system membrane fusion protein
MRNLVNSKHKQDCQFFKGLTLLICLCVFSFNLNATTHEIVLSPEQINNLAIEIGQLKPAPVLALLTAPANVVIPPEHESLVSTPQAGLIHEMNWAVGDRVQKNQPMARLNSPELLILQQRYLQVDHQRQLALSNYQRDQKLLDAGIIPAKRWQESRSIYNSLDSEINSLQQLLAISGMSASEITTLSVTHKFNSQITISTPISGVVLERMAVVGERVNALAPLYKIADIEQLWLEIAIPQEQIDRVHIGDQVRISHHMATATVSLLAQSVNPSTQAVIARAIINRNAADVRVGQSVNVELIQKNQALAYEVPNTALAQNQGQTYLFIRSAQGFKVLAIKVLGKQSNYSIISGALNGSESCAIKGAVALKALWLGLGSDE